MKGSIALPPDRVPKGTRQQLEMLRMRINQIQADDVHHWSFRDTQIAALGRVIRYLRDNDIEGKR